MRYRVEVEQHRFGWIEVDAEPGEPLSSIAERAKTIADESVTIPFWTDDITNETRRIFDADAPCVLGGGEAVRFCKTHETPMMPRQDVCWLIGDPGNTDAAKEWWR